MKDRWTARHAAGSQMAPVKRPATPTRLLLSAMAAALVVCVAPAAGVAAVSETSQRRTSAPDWSTAPSAGSAAACEADPSTPRPASRVLATPGGVASVRETTGLTRADTVALADDPTAHVDACGNVVFFEDVHPADAMETRTLEQTSNAAAVEVPDDIYSLASRPGAAITIYLDVDGDTMLDGWGTGGGETIVSPPFSIFEPADTNFDDGERAAIYKIWRTVVEDFAPFNVNVTTRDPGPGAITRTSAQDTTYGVHVVLTPRNSIKDRCGCGGIAYFGLFEEISDSEIDNTRTAFSFNQFGSTVSHEVGHRLDLGHDGTPSAEYFSGNDEWGPIMGASYYPRLINWSKGEYAQANNQQDDLAIIATHLPLVADDHANTASGATALAANSTATGVITTRTDRDAFSFTGSGETYLQVSGVPDVTNLDLSVTILDANGQQVATVNPTRPAFDSEKALRANWSTTLPSNPATYTAIVDGVGYGNPTVGGQYSDYGSLGAYTITLSTAQPPQPRLNLTPIPATIPTDRYVQSLKVVDIAGGYAPYDLTATGLPESMYLDPDTGRLSGQPSAGTTTVTMTVIDARDNLATATVVITAYDVAPLRAVSQVQQVQGVVGTPLDLTLVTVTGGEGPYVLAAQSVPAGLSFDAATGRLYGTPAYPGSTGMYVYVTDARGRSTSLAPIPIVIASKPVPPPPTPTDPNVPGDTTSDPVAHAPKFLATTLAAARVNKSYRQVIRTSAASQAVMGMRGKLPRGVTVTKKGSRILVQGRAKKTGTYKFRLTLTTPAGTVTRVFALTVRG